MNLIFFESEEGSSGSNEWAQVKRERTKSRAGVLNLFTPIPHFLVGQLSISHHSNSL